MNNNNELISVIIPVYNVEKYLTDCVDSVTAQTCGNIEIILVDDGSVDSSGFMCDEFALRDSRIRVVHKPNGGLSDARNKGLEYASGEYVVFVDSDDVVDAGMVEYLYTLIKDTGSDIGICDAVHCRPNVKIEYAAETERRIYSPQDAVCEMLYQTSFLVSAGGKIYRREYFDDIKFPLGMLFEDSAVMYKIFAKAKKIAYGNARLYGYMHREGSITTNKFSKRDCDILTICDQIVEYMSDKSAALQRAAASYNVVGALRIYLNASPRDEFKPQIDYCVGLIKQKGRQVLFDRRVRRKTKLALLMFFTVRPLMPAVYRHIDRWK